MSENKWQTDQEGFVEAARNDEYAEMELDDHFTLITDTETYDPTFLPYIVGENIHNPETAVEYLYDLLYEQAGFMEYSTVTVDCRNSEQLKLGYYIFHIEGARLS